MQKSLVEPMLVILEILVDIYLNLIPSVPREILRDSHGQEIITNKGLNI